MRVLVIGSGGREHALCWAIAASPLCDALYCAPGNPGIAKEASCVPIAATDIDAILAFARQEKIDFVVVGPEAPLVAGLVDRCEAAGIAAFGPPAAAAALEGSKGFTKDLCAKYDIPTARYRRFSDAEAAKKYARAEGAPIVIKADGLAAGKGVTVAMSLVEAEAAIDDALIANRFGAAGAEVVIEEFLEGEEASFFVLSDGKHALPLASAQDHKRVFDGDKGPNTGGMGAYSPAPCVTPEIAEQVMARIIRPTLDGMAKDGHPYKGVLYAGLMITPQGPKVLEFNVRFGDPECQPILMRLKTDLVDIVEATVEGRLEDLPPLEWRPEPAVCVVMASEGYPGKYAVGRPIRGLDEAAKLQPCGKDSVKVFHAGTATADGQIVTAGGRVLSVTALGQSISEAKLHAYTAVKQIRWAGAWCRKDISDKAMK